VKEARREFLGYLKDFTRAMDADGPFFYGEEFSMVDVAFAPWAVRLWALDYFKAGGLGIPVPGKGGEDEEVWERWRRWVRAIQERETVKKTLGEREYYLLVYKRYADNTAQSEMAKDTRAGRGVP
jgi:glutathione S-transferase